MKCVTIAPSILDVKLEKLPDALTRIENAGAGFVHIDVMDGKFVPNKSYEMDLFKKVVSLCKLKKDVHIMIENPLENAKKYLDEPIDALTFHYEACKDDEEVNKVIDLIHSYNRLAGISIKPNTPTNVLDKFLNKLDLVLIMSVEPGLGGQAFKVESCAKINYLRNKIDEAKLKTLISVDGGIKPTTGRLCREAGVDILVSGSYIFKEDKIEERIEDLLK